MILSESYKNRLMELAGVKGKIYKTYHGTPYKFDKFKLSKAGKQTNAGDFGRGIYFDDDKKVAKSYADESGGYILTVEVKMENPYHVDYVAFSNFKHQQELGKIDRNRINPEVQKYIDELKKSNEDIKLSDVKNESSRAIDFFSVSDNIGADKVAEYLSKAGYDGVIIHYGSSDEIVVFDADQTKIIKHEKVK